MTGCAGTGAGIRTPYSGRREYSQAARGVAAIAEQILTDPDAQAARALVPQLRKAVDRVMRALQYLDDSSGVIGQDLRDLMEAYTRACCAAPSSPGPLAGWLVGLVWDGPGWPEVRLADFAPLSVRRRLSRIADLVAERSPVQAGEPAAEPARDGHLDPEASHQEWAARYLREQLAELTGDVDHYVAVLAEYLGHTDRYRMIATALRDADRRTEAIDWARRGLAARPGDPHADRLRDLLVDLLIEDDDPDARGRAKIGLPAPSARHRRQALHATATRVGLDPAPATDWALDILQARVAQDPRFTRDQVTVLLSAGRQDQGWSVARTHPEQLGEPQLVELPALRAATHPNDVIQPYQELIERHILDSRDKWRYERGPAADDAAACRPPGPRRPRRVDAVPGRTGGPALDPAHLPTQARRLAGQGTQHAQDRETDRLRSCEPRSSRPARRRETAPRRAPASQQPAATTPQQTTSEDMIDRNTPPAPVSIDLQHCSS